MSEAAEKVLGLKHLPIFPLPLVLLPGEALPLHIFEPRYRQMLKDIEFSRKMFGVSFFSQDASFADKPAAESVGCVAEISDMQALGDGRYNVSTAGLIRYRLLDYVDASEPYLIGEVEFFEDFEADAATVNPLADEVYELFKRIARAAHKLNGGRGAAPEIPRAAPQMLSFQAVAAFNLEADLKYRLLETRSTVERLGQAREILVQATGKMEERADLQAASKTNGHSKKKFDFQPEND